MSKNAPAPSAPAPSAPASANRLERILAIAIVAIVALTLVCFISVVVGTYLGAGADDGFSHGLWPTVFSIQYFGLPLAFVLILAVLVSNGIRRSRAAKAPQAGAHDRSL